MILSRVTSQANSWGSLTRLAHVERPSACLCEVGALRPSWEAVIQAAIGRCWVLLPEVVPERQLARQVRLAAVVAPQAAPDLQVKLVAQVRDDIIGPGPRGNDEPVRYNAAPSAGHHAHLFRPHQGVQSHDGAAGREMSGSHHTLDPGWELHALPSGVMLICSAASPSHTSTPLAWTVLRKQAHMALA